MHFTLSSFNLSRSRMLSLRSSTSTLLCLLWFGCADVPPDADLATADPAALHVGDTGVAVREVHDALASAGYLPNDALAELFPNWRPIVLERPRSPDVFDSVLERAVQHFQERNLLGPSGVVDRETLAALRAP